MPLIYEDEELPEIEIRELVSAEQIAEENPSFSIFSEKEVFAHLRQLFKDDQKAVGFRRPS